MRASVKWIVAGCLGLLLLGALLMARAQPPGVGYAPAPPPGPDGKAPWVFSPSAPILTGPTPICIKAKVPPPDYNCYGGDAIDAIIRAQSKEYLEREAMKLGQNPVKPKASKSNGNI